MIGPNVTVATGRPIQLQTNVDEKKIYIYIRREKINLEVAIPLDSNLI